MSSVLFLSDIKDVTDLPVQLNYDIKELLKYISDNNKKYLLLSLLKINKIIIPYYEYSSISRLKRCKEVNKDINFIINLFIKSYHNINIYPKNLNIIHYIVFNKINIYEVLCLAIRIYYMNKCKIYLCNQRQPNIYIHKYYVECNTLIHNICNSYDDTNINISFNHNYTDLLFNGPPIINEISFLTDKINNLQIQTNYYYKLIEEYNVNKNKEVLIINNIINQLNIQNNENNINKNEIIILINKMNNLQIQNDYHYNKINDDIKLIKNKIINVVSQLNTQHNKNNNKLMNKITLLTKQNKVSTKQKYYYYNKIKTLENNIYILNKILSSIVVIYFIIIFIIKLF